MPRFFASLGILVASVFILPFATVQAEETAPDLSPATIPNYSYPTLEFSGLAISRDDANGTLTLSVTLKNGSLDEETYSLAVDFRSLTSTTQDRLYTLRLPTAYTLSGNEERHVQVILPLPAFLMGHYALSLGASDHRGHVAGVQSVTDDLNLALGDRAVLEQCSFAGLTFDAPLDLDQAGTVGTEVVCSAKWTGQSVHPVTLAVRIIPARYAAATEFTKQEAFLNPSMDKVKLLLPTMLPTGTYRLEIAPLDAKGLPLGFSRSTTVTVRGQGGRIAAIAETDRIERDGKTLVPVSVLSDTDSEGRYSLSLTLTSKGKACAEPLTLERANRESRSEFILSGECRYPLITATLLADGRVLDQATRAFGERAPALASWLVWFGWSLLGVFLVTLAFFGRHLVRTRRSRLLPVLFFLFAAVLFGSRSETAKAASAGETFVLYCGAAPCGGPVGSDVSFTYYTPKSTYSPGERIGIVTLVIQSDNPQDPLFAPNVSLRAGSGLATSDLVLSDYDVVGFQDGLTLSLYDPNLLAPSAGGPFVLSVMATLGSAGAPARAYVGPATVSIPLSVTGVTAPPTPTGLQANPSSCGTQTISISWDGLAGQTYVLRDGFNQIYTGTDPAFTHINLTPGSSHSYTLTSSGAPYVGTSGVAGPITVNAPGDCALPPPPAPNGLQANPSACGTGTISITWDAVTGQTYVLQDGGSVIYTGPDGAFTHTGLTPSSAHSYTLSTTAAGPTYSGTSPIVGPLSANAPALCAASAPPIPTGFSAIRGACGTSTISLVWDVIAGQTYVLQDGGSTIYTGPDGAFSHTGLAAGSAHSYTLTSSGAPYVGTSGVAGPLPENAPGNCAAPPAACTTPASLTLQKTSDYTNTPDISFTYTSSLTGTHRAVITTNKTDYAPGENVIITSVDDGWGYWSSPVTNAWFSPGTPGNGTSVGCTAGWDGGAAGNCGIIWNLSSPTAYASTGTVSFGTHSVTVPAPLTAGNHSLPIMLTTRISCNGSASAGCNGSTSAKVPVSITGSLNITVGACAPAASACDWNQITQAGHPCDNGACDAYPCSLSDVDSTYVCDASREGQQVLCSAGGNGAYTRNTCSCSATPPPPATCTSAPDNRWINFSCAFAPCPAATTIFMTGSLDKASYAPGEPVYFKVDVLSDDNPQYSSGVQPIARAKMSNMAIFSADVFPGTYTQQQARDGFAGSVLLGPAPDVSGAVLTDYGAAGYGSATSSINICVNSSLPATPSCTWQDIGTQSGSYPIQTSSQAAEACDPSKPQWYLPTVCPAGVVAGADSSGYANGYTCYDAATKSASATACLAKAYASSCVGGMTLTMTGAKFAFAPDSLWQRALALWREYFRPTAQASGPAVNIIFGESVRLNWVSAGAARCTLAVPNQIPISIDPADIPSGTTVVPGLPVGSHLVSMTCWDTANIQSVNDTVTVNVSAPADLKICPQGNLPIAGNGGSTQLRAYYLASGAVDCTNTGAALDVTEDAGTTWASSNAGVATVSGGLVRSVTNATGSSATITATYAGLADSGTTVTVTCFPTNDCSYPGPAAAAALICPVDSFSISNGCGVTLTCNGTRSCNFNWKEVGQ